MFLSKRKKKSIDVTEEYLIIDTVYGCPNAL